MLLFFLEGREAFLTELSLQGKKDSRDYPDNYCFASAVDGGEDEKILQNFTTCLVRNTCSKDILLRFHCVTRELASINVFLCITSAHFVGNTEEFTSTGLKLLHLWASKLIDCDPFNLFAILFEVLHWL